MIIYNEYNIENLTSLKVKNIAKFVYEVINCHEIYILKYIFDFFGIKYHVLGKGSKVLFKEEYINDPIILISDKFEEIYINKNKVIVSSGYDNKRLIITLANHNLGGFHYLYPLPASIGGMIYMNAADKYICFSDFIEKIIVLDEFNKIIILDKEECNFTYRNSIFKTKKYIILYCVLKLKTIEKNIIIDQICESLNYRIIHQEINKKSCGSLFKNPKNTKAYQLIETIKDKLDNNDKVYLSSKHSNFILNNGASSTEIIQFINSIKELVYQKYDIMLEEELNILD